jgi:hypothetical protein
MDDRPNRSQEADHLQSCSISVTLVMMIARRKSMMRRRHREEDGAGTS